jgi:hypothetical protein
VVVLGIAGTLTQEQIFQPESFLRDYQVVAQVLGHKHIATVSIVLLRDSLIVPHHVISEKGQCRGTL